ncbi:type VI secretion system amidase immunity protein Tai4 [Pseudomonas putida]|uniref:type VI secretion system amidase immunity protein Tai4 n=1 Tax=Pseudomonas putida TaxID=303 RepID=UPI003CC809A0
MSKHWTVVLGVLMIGVGTSVSSASDQIRNSPQAGGRTYAQNYRDMVLATCIATAYRGDADAAKDAGSSVSALRDWTYYDIDEASHAIHDLVKDYLDRDYHNPVVEAEVKGVRFDLLKCLDLYHSDELKGQVQRWVSPPDHTYRQDNPPR